MGQKSVAVPSLKTAYVISIIMTSKAEKNKSNSTRSFENNA